MAEETAEPKTTAPETKDTKDVTNPPESGTKPPENVTKPPDSETKPEKGETEKDPKKDPKDTQPNIKETPMRPKFVTREVDVALTPPEIADHNKKIVDLDINILKVEAEKAIAVSIANSQIKPMKESRDKLIQVIQRKTKKTHMKCPVIYEFEQGIRYVQHPVTGDKLEQNPISQDERKEFLKLGGKIKEDPKNKSAEQLNLDISKMDPEQLKKIREIKFEIAAKGDNNEDRRFKAYRGEAWIDVEFMDLIGNEIFNVEQKNGDKWETMKIGGQRMFEARTDHYRRKGDEKIVMTAGIFIERDNKK